jgi:hypothetical protein
MAISITHAKIESVTVERDGKITGTYSLISEKGDSIAKQSFNDYNGVKFEFDKSIARNLIEEIETEIELTIGIQEVVKAAVTGEQ